MAAARAGGVGADLGQTAWMSAIRCGSDSVSPRSRMGALAIGGEHRFDQAFGTRRRFLGDASQPDAGGNRDRTRFGLGFARDQPEKSRFARAVGTDNADLVALGDGKRGSVEQKTVAASVC